jgi:hypothetical protein
MQIFVSSIGNMEGFFHTNPIVCALAYFDPKKYFILKKNYLFLTFIYQLFIADAKICRNYNFLIPNHSRSDSLAKLQKFSVLPKPVWSAQTVEY